MTELHHALQQLSDAARHVEVLRKRHGMGLSILLRCDPHGIRVNVANGTGRGSRRRQQRVAYNLIGMYPENALIHVIDTCVEACGL